MERPNPKQHSLARARASLAAGAEFLANMLVPGSGVPGRLMAMHAVGLKADRDTKRLEEFWGQVLGEDLNDDEKQRRIAAASEGDFLNLLQSMLRSFENAKCTLYAVAYIQLVEGRIEHKDTEAFVDAVHSLRLHDFTALQRIARDQIQKVRHAMNIVEEEAPATIQRLLHAGALEGGFDNRTPQVGGFGQLLLEQLAGALEK